MGTEIIRRNTQETSLARTNEARRTMDLALARLRNYEVPQTAVTRTQQTELSSYRAVAQDVVDVPRICAVHGAPYVARYILSNGRYRYAQSIRFRTALHDQYVAGPEFETVVPPADIAEEACAWCGASGHGAIRCGTCKKLMCWGKTVERYFKCQQGCRGEGEIRNSNEPLGRGINPSHDAKAGKYGA